MKRISIIFTNLRIFIEDFRRGSNKSKVIIRKEKLLTNIPEKDFGLVKPNTTLREFNIYHFNSGSKLMTYNF